jgi:hypothetical protein
VLSFERSIDSLQNTNKKALDVDLCEYYATVFSSHARALFPQDPRIRRLS